MNTSRIIVRLDAEQRAAELEIMTPHHHPRVQGVEEALRRIGMMPMHSLELSTPRYRVFRTKLRELDGSALGSTRVVHVLRAVRNRALHPEQRHGFRAA